MKPSSPRGVLGVTLAAAAVVVVSTALFATPAQSADPLRVCLDESASLLSSKHGEEGQGFDLEVAKALAGRLSRPLEIQWFESELDDESHPVREANALLSDSRCDLIAGYPLFATAIGAPRAEYGHLPDYEGMTHADRRRKVALSEVAASIGYRYAPLVVVLGPDVATRRIDSLADLEGLAIGAEEGTLSGAILMSYDGGRFVARITQVAPGGSLLERLAAGDFQATLVELSRVDAYLAAHPEAGLTSTGHYHSLGHNVGFLGLASDSELLSDVDAAIKTMRADGKIRSIAEATGLTYVPPRKPNVLPAISPLQLYGD